LDAPSLVRIAATNCSGNPCLSAATRQTPCGQRVAACRRLKIIPGSSIAAARPDVAAALGFSNFAFFGSGNIERNIPTTSMGF
jgi:hypothetical protein